METCFGRPERHETTARVGIRLENGNWLVASVGLGKSYLIQPIAGHATKKLSLWRDGLELRCRGSADLVCWATRLPFVLLGKCYPVPWSFVCWPLYHTTLM